MVGKYILVLPYVTYRHRAITFYCNTLLITYNLTLMTKRRISQRQAQMIAGIQAERVKRVGARDAKLLGEVEQSGLGPEEHGLVLAHHGARAEVESENGEHYPCLLRQHLGHLITGDRVIWRRGQNELGVVVALLPRTSELTRTTDRGIVKPIAANIDQILVTVAVEPAYSLEHLDPYLIAATLQHIPAVIVLNKIDQCPQPYPDVLADWIALYRGLGYPVIETSSTTQLGLQQLAQQLQHHTSVFVGQSGVGKSSLIASFLPNADIRIGTFTPEVGHGTHTTSTARLYHLPSGGDLIDSPGIRELKLGPLTPAELIQGFIEFHPYLNACKFRDCSHTHEPECMILQAVADGKINSHRLQAFHNLLKK